MLTRIATRTSSRGRSAYTLAELLILVALISVGSALFVEYQRQPQARRPGINSISLAAGGDRAFATFDDGSLTAWELTTGEVVGGLKATERFDDHRPITISPDGRRVARTLRADPMPPFGYSTDVQVCDSLTGRELFCRRDMSGGAKALSPDGTQLAIVNFAANELRVIDLIGSAEDIVLTPLETSGPKNESIPYEPLMFSANGREVFRWSRDGELVKWNLDTKQTVRKQIAKPWLFHCWACSPDGGHLVVANSEPGPLTTVELMSTVDLATIGQSTISGPIYAVAFINSGRSLALLRLQSLDTWSSRTLQLEKQDNFAPKVGDLLTLPPHYHSGKLKSIMYSWGNRCAVTDSPQGPVAAVADQQTRISVLDGNGWREGASTLPSPRRKIMLWIALPAIVAVWIGYRRRQSMRLIDLSNRLAL